MRGDQTTRSTCESALSKLFLCGGLFLTRAEIVRDQSNIVNGRVLKMMRLWLLIISLVVPSCTNILVWYRLPCPAASNGAMGSFRASLNLALIGKMLLASHLL